MKVIVLSAMIMFQGSWVPGHKQFSQLEPRIYKSMTICLSEKKKHLRTFRDNRADIKKYYDVTKVRLTCKSKRVRMQSKNKNFN